MESNGFSTEQLRMQDQHDAWSEWFRPVFDVYPTRREMPGFVAQYAAWQLGELTVTRVAAPPTRTVRSATHLRHSPVDHWVVSYCRDCATQVETRRGHLEARAGVPFLWSLGQVSDSSRHVADRLQLYLPRDSFPDLAAQLDQTVGTMLDTPVGML